jgi:PKD repeat protein
MGRARNVGVWTQRIAVAAVVALVVGLAVRVGSSSSQSLDFRDPLIWLVSTTTGQVVQADAGSGEVTARVSVGSGGDSLDIVQHGPDALVLNRTTGEVMRVSGSQLAVAERSPVTVDPGSQLLGRNGAARVVTGSSVIPVDPRNAAVGDAVEVPALRTPVLDDDGALWGIDPENHVLVVTDAVGEVRLPTETRPFALVDAGGAAQLLDGAGPTLVALESADSGLGDERCVGGDVGPGVAVGGSVDAGHTAVMVDGAAGVVRMNDLVEGRCTSATLEGFAGATFGAAVESGGLVYVPVLSTGEVVVVRVAEGTVVSHYSVTGPDRPFELTVKDGTVWFDEPNGSHAGVLGPEGLLAAVDKYDEVAVSGAQEGGQPSTPPDATGGQGPDDGVGTGQPQVGPGQPGAQPGDGNSDAGGGDPRSVGSNGSAEGPVEDVDLTGLVADFTFSKRVVEVGEEVRFVDRSQGGPVSWTWEFGDGSFATGPEASHSWDEVGAYRVTLRIEGETGTAAASATIEVIDENTRSRPNADFRYSASRVEVGQPVTFTDRSTGNATELRWDFGDGSAATGASVQHAWTKPGTYKVALTATNALGSDTSPPATITVFDRVEAPTAAIAASTTAASVNQTVQFTSRSTGNPTELQWDFDDGTSARGERVSHAWTSPGTYDVRLRVSNSAGSDEATVRVVVDERVVAPEARIVASTTMAEEGQPVRFTSVSINNPTRLVWEFGDGATDSGASVTHAFARAGRYTVTLRASNSAGEDDDTLTIVVVADVPAPVAAFGTTPDGPLTAGTPIQFTDQSTGGVPTSWSWDFGDGTAPSSLRNPTHVFAEPGRYEIRLVVENSGGRDEVRRSVEVRPPAPLPDFTFSPATPNAGQEVQFTDTSRNVSSDATWLWEFGDGGRSTDRNPRHTFTERGTFTVKLTVTNAAGPVSTSKAVAVNPRAPIARFRFTPGSNVTTATSVRFDYVAVPGSGEPDTLTWDFKDGTPTQTGRSVTHTFARAGTFDVTLTAVNQGGRS